MNMTGWDRFAGGICAADGKYSYQRYSPLGRYDISPVAKDGRHVGYQVSFINEFGLLPGGLYQPLGLTNLRQAVRLCREHEKANPKAA